MLKGTLEKLETTNVRPQDPHKMSVKIPRGINVGSGVLAFSGDHPGGGIFTSEVVYINKHSKDEIIFKTLNSTYRLFDYETINSSTQDSSMLSQL